MCYFCHVLNKNPHAPLHHSSKCWDKANSFSHIPMDKRMYENGKRIQKEQSNTDTTCTVCLERSRNMTFIPCGHVATCDICSSNLVDCPICRQHITGKQKLYFP
ncbi:unnamed protein product [Rotaria sp. Silwood1]|nr:unnamed protein product [Rotaria sp. Silwood1]CAF0835829.1 unnamed protein product [Rotaria sp. Silwood1]CAF0933112.1 unnamed protein product [Rotaria sp. Silwood1]CAF3339757.1 unnamed protein product [Rotaria sp. Silwood1]CAF3366755.1 unnamed protein product [Rotaria sp. Silwood1]